MQVGNEALVLSAVGVIGLGCQWLAWRMRLPAILFLLLAGIIVGPILQWLNPDEILGDLLFPLVSLAVAVILFEGSLTLNFKEIRGVSGSVWSIVSVGAIISWVATSVATHYFLIYLGALNLVRQFNRGYWSNGDCAVAANRAANLKTGQYTALGRHTH